MYPDFIITTANCIFQCSYNAHSIHFKTGKSTTALPIRKFLCRPFSYRVCDLLVYLNLYVWKICSYYEFASRGKYIRHCINQNQPPNLRLKGEIKSTSLILQTAKVSRKGKPQRNVTLSEIDTLLSLKIFRNTNYLTGN